MTKGEEPDERSTGPDIPEPVGDPIVLELPEPPAAPVSGPSRTNAGRLHRRAAADAEEDNTPPQDD